MYLFLYMFKLKSPSKYSPFDTVHPTKHFFHCSKQFSNLPILMPFSASAIFGFTSSTLANRFPLRTFFTWGNKKWHSGEIMWIGRVGHRGHIAFGQTVFPTTIYAPPISTLLSMSTSPFSFLLSPFDHLSRPFRLSPYQQQGCFAFLFVCSLELVLISFKTFFLCIHNLAQCLVQETQLSTSLGFQHVFFTNINYFWLLV